MSADGVIPFAPLQDEFRYIKSFSRYLFNIVHLSVALILFLVLLMATDQLFMNPFILYLIPIILLIQSTNAFHICCCTAPVFLTNRLGIFNTLRGRGFIYQASGAFIIAHSNCGGVLFAMAGALV